MNIEEGRAVLRCNYCHIELMSQSEESWFEYQQSYPTASGEWIREMEDNHSCPEKDEAVKD